MRACELFRKRRALPPLVFTYERQQEVIHQIDYDLRKPGRNYESLYEAIRAFGVYAHALESTWLVETQLSAGQVRDRLRSHTDSNDRLLVTRLTGESAWYGLDPVVEQWLQQRMSRAA